MKKVSDALQQNLQLLYRKALDADTRLDQLRQQGQAKHQAIFPAEAGFAINSNRFKPYVEALATAVQDLEKQEAAQVEAQLANVVQQMQQLFTTLEQFKKASAGQ